MDLPQIDGISLEPMEPGRLLDPRTYHSKMWHSAEIEGFFARHWNLISDVHQLEKAGAYISDEIGEVPVVILRDSDGGLRGFVNSCPHRGTLLLEGSGNCGNIIRCPYHGWTFSTGGKLRKIPQSASFPQVPASLGLTEIRVDTLGPLIFATLSQEMPALKEWAGVTGQAIEKVYDHGWKFGFEARLHAEANWKLFIENMNESYHVPFIHDLILDRFKSESPSGQFSDTRIVVNEWTSYTLLEYANRPGDHGRKQVVAGADVMFGFLPPNIGPIIEPENIAIYRVDPKGPDEFDLKIRFYCKGLNAEQIQHRQQRFLHTARQDIEIIERVQRGTNGPKFQNGFSGEDIEKRVRHFQELVHGAVKYTVSPARSLTQA